MAEIKLIPVRTKMGRTLPPDSATLQSTAVAKEVDELRCGVCLEFYEDPRILPCLHTFCLECLRKAAAKGTVKCPTCRGEHSLPASGVSRFLSNSKLKSEIEGHRFSQALSKTCGSCDDQQAEVVGFCADCQQFLCQPCDFAHKRLIVFKTHVVVRPSEAKYKPKAIVYPCPNHPKELLKVYCTNCKEVICRDCALYSHQHHSFQPAEQAAAKVRQQLSILEVKVSSKLKEFEGYMSHIQLAEKHITEHPDKLKAEISATFESLTRELAKRHQDLLNEVDNQYDKFAKQLGGEKDGVSMTVCNLQASLRFANRVQHSTNKMEVSVLGTKACSQMTKISQSSWNPRVVDQLGPLIFDSKRQMRDSNDTCRLAVSPVMDTSNNYDSTNSTPEKTPVAYIRSIGLVQKMDKVVIKLANHNPKFFKANTKFTLSVTASAVDGASVWNYGTLSSDVKLLSTVALCTIESQVTPDHAVSFIPPEKGNYEIKVSFSISGKVCGTATRSIQLRSAPVISRSDNPIYSPSSQYGAYSIVND